MHPAGSVIAFTTLSGVGFGLLAWLGLALAPPLGWEAFWLFALAFGMAVGGLLASTLHLGHPERALKAFTQWRSSWLSREAVCAVAALVVMGLYAAALVFWHRPFWGVGWVGAALSLGTVFTTSMIYAQLKTVPRWHSPLTCALYLVCALAGGALVVASQATAIAMLLLAAAVQIAWWWRGDRAFAAGATTLATATGLEAGGGLDAGGGASLRALAPPHSAPNYLTREFFYVVGRRHALKLRVMALLLLAVVPIALLLVPAQAVVAPIALASHICGITIARWLFFAEAEHVVSLYYGTR